MTQQEFESCFETRQSDYMNDLVWLIRRGFYFEEIIEGVTEVEGDITVRGVKYHARVRYDDSEWGVTLQLTNTRVVTFYTFEDGSHTICDYSIEEAFKKAIGQILNAVAKEA